MKTWIKTLVVTLSLGLVAVAGLVVSFSAPHIKSGDELVYLTGALQAKEHNLPDSYMLQGYDYGPYIYPRIMSYFYESLGHQTYKSVVLLALIFAIGLGAYFMFRLAGLPWVPSLLFAIVALLPRFASGQEIFGRGFSLFLVFVMTGFFLKFVREKRPLWPLFGISGIFIFLHPVTVLLFVFISIVAMIFTYVITKVSWVKIVKETICSGLAFVSGGSYLFFEVFIRMSRGFSSADVLQSDYISAIVARNAWEFPVEVARWFPHMFIVSAFFILLIFLYFVLNDAALPELFHLNDPDLQYLHKQFLGLDGD